MTDRHRRRAPVAGRAAAVSEALRRAADAVPHCSSNRFWLRKFSTSRSPAACWRHPRSSRQVRSRCSLSGRHRSRAWPFTSAPDHATCMPLPPGGFPALSLCFPYCSTYFRIGAPHPSFMRSKWKPSETGGPRFSFCLLCGLTLHNASLYSGVAPPYSAHNPRRFLYLARR